MIYEQGKIEQLIRNSENGDVNATNAIYDLANLIGRENNNNYSIGMVTPLELVKERYQMIPPSKWNDFDLKAINLLNGYGC